MLKISIKSTPPIGMQLTERFIFMFNGSTNNCMEIVYPLLLLNYKSLNVVSDKIRYKYQQLQLNQYMANMKLYH